MLNRQCGLARCLPVPSREQLVTYRQSSALAPSAQTRNGWRSVPSNLIEDAWEATPDRNAASSTDGVYIAQEQVGGMGYETEHNSGLVGITGGLAKRLNLARQTVRSRRGSRRGRCLVVFGPSIKGSPRWRKSQRT